MKWGFSLLSCLLSVSLLQVGSLTAGCPCKFKPKKSKHKKEFCQQMNFAKGGCGCGGGGGGGNADELPPDDQE